MRRPSPGGPAISRTLGPCSIPVAGGPGGQPVGRGTDSPPPRVTGPATRRALTTQRRGAPRVCAPTARRPTRAVQSGLRVTKSRARLRPDRDRRTDPRRHRPSAVPTKFQSSLPREGRGVGAARLPWPCPPGSDASRLGIQAQPPAGATLRGGGGSWLELRAESLGKRGAGGHEVPLAAAPALRDASSPPLPGKDRP